MLRYLQFSIYPAVYFIIYYSVPWRSFSFFREWDPISPSNIFTAIYCIVCLKILKPEKILGEIQPNNIGGNLFLSGGLSIIVIDILYEFDFTSFNIPFSFLNDVIIRPILLEFLYRGVFFSAGEKAEISPNNNTYINFGLAFFTHFFVFWSPAFFSLGNLVYVVTFSCGLGYLCCEARHRTKGVLEPILIHMLFGLIFYLSSEFDII